jgi:hypothetical protein
MTSLYNLIKENRPNIAESSIKTYVFSLKKLGITDEEDIDFIYNPNDIFDEIKDMKSSQQRNLLSSVLIIIKAKKMGDELYEIYRKKCFELGEEFNLEQSKNEKTETQERNWVKMSQLIKIANKKYKQSPGSQETLITSLYSLQPPSRLDYYDCKIVRSEAELNDKKNFLLIHNTRRKEFIFNDYKSANKYNTVRVPVSKALNKVINKFLKLNPDREFLLQSKKGVHLSRNLLGKLIPRAFAETGKHVTLNIIRHVYISEKVDIDAVKSCNTLAANMMHSNATQLNYAKV